MQFAVCAVCAQRELIVKSGLTTVSLSHLLNRYLLCGQPHHCRDELVCKYVLQSEGCSIKTDDVDVQICDECLRQLKVSSQKKPPTLSLANGLWIRRTPWELRQLTIPEQLLIARAYSRVFVIKLYLKNQHRSNPDALFSALHRNVMTYPLNMDHISRMISGTLMPQTPRVLANVDSLPSPWPTILKSNMFFTT